MSLGCEFDQRFQSGFFIGYALFSVSVLVAYVLYFLPWVHVGKGNKRMTLATLAILTIRRKNKRIAAMAALQTVEVKQEMTTEIIAQEKIVRRMSFSELSNATDNFCVNNIVGSGKMGIVYKVKFRKGYLLAVKRLHDYQQSKDQLVFELEILGRLRHNNLLLLLGFCLESNERLLVYKYMSNGNLFNLLHSKESKKKMLEWPIRVKIAVGLARGLAWLHHVSNFRVAHQNISSKCILLDKNFEPKLSNFEKAIIINQSGNDLECEFFKKDVFNFGIVILELITGKQLNSSHSFYQSLAQWKSDSSANSCCLQNAIDMSLIGKGNDNEIIQLLKVAFSCVQQLPEQRLNMLDIYKTIRAIRKR